MPSLIRKIVVRKLFGHFSYVIDFAIEDRASADRLGILYGDNGSGKTTILKLLYHLLSPVDGRGHKTMLVETKFESFEVILSTGARITARRPRGKTSGGLKFTLARKKRILHSASILVDEEGDVQMTRTQPEGKALAKFLHKLRELDLELFFLRDDRRLTSSFDDSYALTRERRAPATIQERIDRRPTRRLSALEEAIENVNVYFRRSALIARSRGEQDINKVYRDIVRTLSRPGRTRAVGGLTIASAVEQLQLLANRNEPFRHLGLTTELPVAEIIDRLGRARQSSRRALLNVVKPYIDSLRARLDALEVVQQTISRFLAALNSFLGPLKCVGFSLSEGLEIISQGELLHPRSLSSGERQLLTIFCQILRPQDHSTVFIIDEPELSLNVKWQRQLLHNLLDCTRANPIQFLIASHSMEVLARHRADVVLLTHTPPRNQDGIASPENDR